MTAYIALLHKDPGNDYGVEFPDFPGCVTAGKDLDDARRMASEALALHIASMNKDGEAIPAPSSMEAVMQESASRKAVAFLVDIATKPVKALRVNIMLPEDVLKAIDEVTNNRSRFLAEAARAKLGAA